MQTSTLIMIVLVLTAVAYVLGRQRSVQLAQLLGGIKTLHSLPNYYGLMAAVWTGLPALIVLIVWTGMESTVINGAVVATLPESYTSESEARLSLTFSRIQNIQKGTIDGSQFPELVQAGQLMQRLTESSQFGKVALTLVIAFLGGAYAWLRTSPKLRARPQFEVVLKGFFCCVQP